MSGSSGVTDPNAVSKNIHLLMALDRSDRMAVIRAVLAQTLPVDIADSGVTSIEGQVGSARYFVCATDRDLASGLDDIASKWMGGA